MSGILTGSICEIEKRGGFHVVNVAPWSNKWVWVCLGEDLGPDNGVRRQT